MAEIDSPKSSQDDEQFAQQLAWKLLDGQLEEEEAEQLDLLLTHSSAARQAYVQVVQLHLSLLDHFGALPTCDQMLKKTLATQPPAVTNPASISTAPISAVDSPAT